VGPGAGLDAVAERKNPRFCRESNPGLPARILVTVLTGLFCPTVVLVISLKVAEFPASLSLFSGRNGK
jgi:hypothetical protein